MTATPTSPALPPEAPWRAGLRGARANLVPGLILQAFAIVIVAAYYGWPAARGGFDAWAEFRTRSGVWYAIGATAVFGGVLPVIFMRFQAHGEKTSLTQDLWLVAFWAYKGLEIQLWYNLLIALFGEGTGFLTLTGKVLVDQFIYCPIWAIPSSVLAYEWRALNFNTAALLADMRAPRWYARRVLPALISNLGIWIPAVYLIFSLPTALQLPMQNIVLCFFTLIMAHLARREKAPAPARAA